MVLFKGICGLPVMVNFHFPWHASWWLVILPVPGVRAKDVNICIFQIRGLILNRYSRDEISRNFLQITCNSTLKVKKKMSLENEGWEQTKSKSREKRLILSPFPVNLSLNSHLDRSNEYLSNAVQCSWLRLQFASSINQ